MKKKELKRLAEKIAKCERIISTSFNRSEVHRAQDDIITLSGHVTTLEDITIIDEMVQEILNKN